MYEGAYLNYFMFNTKVIICITKDWYLWSPGLDARVATKIFEGFREVLFKEFIMGREPVSKSTTLGLEPVSIVHYTRPGTCINCPLH